MKKTYSTPQAAKKIGVSFSTLNRWIRGREDPSAGNTRQRGRTLWYWTDADIAKGRKVKAAQKPGPKPKGRKP